MMVSEQSDTAAFGPSDAALDGSSVDRVSG
jgi:hypothetical protein